MDHLGAKLYTRFLQNKVLDQKIKPNLLGYVDDHSAYAVFESNSREDKDSCVQTLQRDLDNILNWMNMNRLQMNPNKIEFIFFGNTKHIRKCETSSIGVGGNMIPKSNEATSDLSLTITG